MACPSGFTLRTSEPRGCKRQLFEAATCKSVIFSSGGQWYSRVCGRVNAYQQGTTDAFNIAAGPRTLEEIYVDGVSLTHGAPGSRQHIWTSLLQIFEEEIMLRPLLTVTAPIQLLTGLMHFLPS